MCRSIGFCQFKLNWVHMQAACQLVITMVFAWNNFPSKQLINRRERVCHPGYGVTHLPRRRLLLTCLLRQAQLSDTARNFPFLFWHNVKFLSFLFQAGRLDSEKTDIRHEWEEEKTVGRTSGSQSEVVTNLLCWPKSSLTFFLTCLWP